MNRIQRKRKSGWRKPENTVNVTRPGKWGNPLKLVGDQIFIHAVHRRKDPWVFLCMGDIEKMLRIFECIAGGVMLPGEYGFKLDMMADLLHWTRHFKSLDWSELKGKNLMCFCSLDKPCHADVLLKIANR